MTLSVMTSKGLMNVPRVGSWWMHNNGKAYQVFALTNLSDRQTEYPATICYRGPNGSEWSKPLTEWYTKMTPMTDLIEQRLKAHVGQVLTEANATMVALLWDQMMSQQEERK